ncbi:MAG: hypothetical protein ACYDEQ_15520, partial [Desulfocucumaceae bacterium]
VYNYHSGEIKNPGLELMLILIRILIFAIVVVATGAVGVAAGLPAFVGGIAGGLVIFALFATRPFFEVINYSCPNCGNQARVVKNFGAYRCSNCSHESRIED